MAEWMAVTLSAPSVALTNTTGAVQPSGSFPQHLLNITRPSPSSDHSELEVSFPANEIDVQALNQYDMVWWEESPEDVGLCVTMKQNKKTNLSRDPLVLSLRQIRMGRH